MIRIAITAADAIAATLPLGSVGFEREPADDGERLVWLETRCAEKLNDCALREADGRRLAPLERSPWRSRRVGG
jgi:hypothetical protein